MGSRSLAPRNFKYKGEWLYNPDIANVFYRAGFIENWGRGIETICSACRELGAEQPTYELRGNSLRVRFAAL